MPLSHCPNFSVWLVKQEQDKTLFSRARCKRWSCPYCAEVNKNLWTARMLYAVDRVGGDWSFVTLTAHEKTRTTAMSWKNISTGWNRLNLRLKRQFGTFYYVRVYEMTKRGSFHLHMLISVKATKKFWKDNARTCGMGYQADTKKIESNAHAVFYCAKYMTKEPDGFPRNVRRITCSRNFPDREKDKKHDWACIGNEVLWSDIVHWTSNLSVPAVDYDTGHVINSDDYLLDNVFNLD